MDHSSRPWFDVFKAVQNSSVAERNYLQTQCQQSTPKIDRSFDTYEVTIFKRPYLRVKAYHRAVERHLPYGITQFTCHPTQVNAPCINPNQAGRYSIYLPRKDGTLSRPR